MRPKHSLPLPPGATDEVKFRDDLLQFACSSRMWQMLCGGIHMLDFLVREPDLYATVVPEDWREWFQGIDIMDVIELLNREDVDLLPDVSASWRGYRPPPKSLISYIRTVRGFLFDRSFAGAPSRPQGSEIKPLSRRLAQGMNAKKIHEVCNFSAFVNDMCEGVSASTGEKITDVVDFGAGQGYLGRSLASPLYKINVVSVESKPHNVAGAKRTDILARLSDREVVYRNKKLYRAGADADEIRHVQQAYAETAPSDAHANDAGIVQCGLIRHIEHRITGGDLGPVIDKLNMAKLSFDEDSNHEGSTQVDLSTIQESRLMVISLHSCGNLLHHGLRSLIMNESIKAVAMIGCCYNLCTERIGGPSFKLPNLRLRSQNKRFIETSNACAPDGFPMSDHFMNYNYGRGVGIRLNITARMMAVQAPRNWTRSDSQDFFTRHWYRALFQRVLVDRGIVQPVICHDATAESVEEAGDVSQPISIGRLGRICFTSFVAYVRGALSKLVDEETRGELFRQLNEQLTDAEIAEYDVRHAHRRHDLCVLWSLMAFSAGVVEAMIILDRWQWLREQKDVSDAWVQAVFDYSISPRNLVVVGVKS